MNGINAADGTKLSGIDHLKQSIRDIITTPQGTRVMRRDYGSKLFQLIDAPMNRGTISDIRASVVDALSRLEPRISVSKVAVIRAAPGEIELSIEGTYLPDGQAVKLDGIVIS